eukprot:4614729-Amphidinium_carterae.1
MFTRNGSTRGNGAQKQAQAASLILFTSFTLDTTISRSCRPVCHADWNLTMPNGVEEHLLGSWAGFGIGLGRLMLTQRARKTHSMVLLDSASLTSPQIHPSAESNTGYTPLQSTMAAST